MSKVENQDSGMKRGLKDRHISMIAMGGCIGTGLFMTSGGAIHDAGALGALIAYAIIGAMVFFLMTSLGEMATYLPVSGSFSTYATRFVDPSLGFALGWNYWFNWVITVITFISANQYSLSPYTLTDKEFNAKIITIKIQLHTHAGIPAIGVQY